MLSIMNIMYINIIDMYRELFLHKLQVKHVVSLERIQAECNFTLVP